MCVPACTRKVAQQVSRRGFLKAAAGFGAAGATLAVSGCVPISHELAEAHRTAHGAARRRLGFDRLVDLTHTLTEDFPTFGGEQQLEFETIVTLDADGYNMYRWLLVEHTGTHMDAPFHFSNEGLTADQIPADDLIGPLAVVDISARAEEAPDAQLTPDDLRAWERVHGPLPPGAVVAMHSGWQKHLGTPKFRNADDEGALHFPGFHVEAVEWLLETDAKGIFVDTMSLDYGPSADFAVHYRWLPENRWGMEAVANLNLLPARGAFVVVGGPKIAGATGGPSRIFAFV